MGDLALSVFMKREMRMMQKEWMDVWLMDAVLVYKWQNMVGDMKANEVDMEAVAVVDMVVADEDKGVILDHEAGVVDVINLGHYRRRYYSRSRSRSMSNDRHRDNDKSSYRRR